MRVDRVDRAVEARAQDAVEHRRADRARPARGSHHRDRRRLEEVPHGGRRRAALALLVALERLEGELGGQLDGEAFARSRAISAGKPDSRNTSSMRRFSGRTSAMKRRDALGRGRPPARCAIRIVPSPRPAQGVGHLEGDLGTIVVDRAHRRHGPRSWADRRSWPRGRALCRLSAPAAQRAAPRRSAPAGEEPQPPRLGRHPLQEAPAAPSRSPRLTRADADGRAVPQDDLSYGRAPSRDDSPTRATRCIAEGRNEHP